MKTAMQLVLEKVDKIIEYENPDRTKSNTLFLIRNELVGCINIEKQQIVDAVNHHEAKATKQANFWIKKISKKKIDLVESIPDAGIKYYNETFSK